MYPSRPSKKILIMITVIILLGSAFLIFGKSDIQSAAAYFSQGNITDRQLNVSAGKLSEIKLAAPVQPSSIDIRISAGADDAEQRVTDGFMYIDSSDLELTNDPGVTKANQSVGMLFTDVVIPSGSAIVQAYIEFEVDEASSEATSLVFHGQAADSAAPFTTSTNDISSRNKTSAAMTWDNLSAWTTVGARVQTPDLSSVIQEIINRTGWVSGNNLAIIVDGTGRRVASAYEAGARMAAVLHISFLPADISATSTWQPPAPTGTPLPLQPTSTQGSISSSGSLDLRVSARDDDGEQRLSDGHMYIESSDLEMVDDRGVQKALQAVGIRFAGVNIPRGATIVQAYLEFQVDEATSEPTVLVFHGEAVDNAEVFANIKNNITNRPKTSVGIRWDNIPGWNTVGAKIQSPDISGIIQEIINRSGWIPGNSLAIIVDGSGRRVASAYESGSQKAVSLHIAYVFGEGSVPPTSPPPPPTSTTPPPTPTSTALPPTPTVSVTTPPPLPTNTPIPTSQTGVLDVQVAVGNDDIEQRVTDGYMYMNSSDLEMTNDPGVAVANQSVGIRFTGVNIPKGSIILQAYIEFQVDEATSENTSLVFHGEAVDSSAAFTTAAYNLSTRVKTVAAVNWNNISVWNTVGAKVQTPDLTPIIQEIVNRTGWVTGNSLAIIVDGTGRRVASAYEAKVQGQPWLHVVYLPFIITSTPTATPPGALPTATSLPPTPTTTPITPSPTNTPFPPAPTNTPMPTSSPTSNPSPSPVGQSGSWRMVFNDEFNGSSLDSSKWRTCFWWADTTCSIETNKELELYNPQDVLVQNGVLRLRAQKRDMVAWNGVTYHYTAGMVMSGGRSGKIPPEFTFTYGYAEARVWVPAGKGLWPAFWMLPVSYNSRPEIDIMEILGDTTTQYHMNYHYIGGDAGTTWNGPDFSSGWHVIGIDWQPTAIVWYVDGVERWRYTDQAKISNEPEYLLLNLAVGGTWPGSPDSNTAFPSYFDVDYVRVWQH